MSDEFSWQRDAGCIVTSSGSAVALAPGERVLTPSDVAPAADVAAPRGPALVLDGAYLRARVLVPAGHSPTTATYGDIRRAQVAALGRAADSVVGEVQSMLAEDEPSDGRSP